MRQARLRPVVSPAPRALWTPHCSLCEQSVSWPGCICWHPAGSCVRVDAPDPITPYRPDPEAALLVPNQAAKVQELKRHRASALCYGNLPRRLAGGSASCSPWEGLCSHCDCAKRQGQASRGTPGPQPTGRPAPSSFPQSGDFHFPQPRLQGCRLGGGPEGSCQGLVPDGGPAASGAHRNHQETHRLSSGPTLPGRPAQHLLLLRVGVAQADGRPAVQGPLEDLR